MNKNTITLQFPIYNKETWVLWIWNEESKVLANINLNEKSILISWNKNWLLSLAQYLVSLAQDWAPTWSHFHLDDFSYLESGSSEIIFEKIN